jgi:hypothetical protein
MQVEPNTALAAESSVAPVGAPGSECDFGCSFAALWTSTGPRRVCRLYSRCGSFEDRGRFWAAFGVKFLLTLSRGGPDNSS